MRAWTLNVGEAFLSLVAGRHFAQMNRRGAATAGRGLAAAMLVAIVAGYFLTRTTRDEMYNRVSPQHADLVMPINLVLWVGRLIVFGMLCMALAERASDSSSARSGAK